MRVVICYDIADDRRRDRIVKHLLNYGPRMEESVFTADLEPARLDELRAAIPDLIDGTVDRVHVFPVCAACWKSAQAFGAADLPEDPKFYLL